MNARWIARESSFEDAFPTVKSIDIEYTQDGDGVDERSYPKVELSPTIPTLRCDNPRCKQGGVNLGNYVRSMVSEKTTYKKFETGCIGHEGSPKGVRPGALCCNYFSVEIAITYHKADYLSDEVRDA